MSQLWVQRDDEGPVLLACGGGDVNNVSVPWITEGSFYKFSLYDSIDCDATTKDNNIKHEVFLYGE